MDKVKLSKIYEDALKNEIESYQQMIDAKANKNVLAMKGKSIKRLLHSMNDLNFRIENNDQL